MPLSEYHGSPGSGHLAGAGRGITGTSVYHTFLSLDLEHTLHILQKSGLDISNVAA